MDEFLSATIRGLAQGSLYTLLGLGFVIIYKGTRVVNFAQPVLMIFGAYFTSYFVLALDLPFALGVLAAVLTTAAIAAVSERVALRPMVGEQPFSAAMVTVGVLIALQVIANDLLGLELRQMGDPWGLSREVLGGVAIFHRDIAALLITASVVAGMAVFFKLSRIGLALRAAAFDQEAALAQGVPVGRMFGISWAISGGLAALAGLLVGTGGAGVDQNTTFIALKALPAIILGGLDSIPGAVVGGLAIGMAETYTKVYQPEHFAWAGANFDQVVPYLVMLLVLLVRPYGLFGTKEVERV
ncbi:MAG TPA: branched-chain amino acid ABC transporter permease [Actinomycetota bacterium]|nr:branched-chain amino acid ABC transporter permease [Actinomycetota bacterium]